MTFFVFKKNSLKIIPDFVIGRPGYDNWLIWYARRKLISVIDISNDVKPIHQNIIIIFTTYKMILRLQIEVR